MFWVVTRAFGELKIGIGRERGSEGKSEKGSEE